MKLGLSVHNRMLQWKTVYKQQRTLINVIRVAICMLLNPSRSTITQSLVYGGLESEDWSMYYKLFSRSKWDYPNLFKPIIQETITYYPDNYISLAVDDTKIKKTGKNIPDTQYYIDPMSPPFHPNLMYGHRVLQFCAILPLYKQITPDQHDEERHYHVSRGIPVSVDNVPAVKKPGRKADADEIENYKILKKKSNLSLFFVDRAQQLRKDYDSAGASEKTLLIVADGSFCNGTVFKADFERTNIVARCRNDARLCFEDTTSSRKFYSTNTFTPLSVRQDESIEYKGTMLYIGKKLRKLRYKEVDNILWQRGAGRKKLRLIVIAPKPYKKHGKKQNYKREAYLLTDNHELSAEIIIQEYINRWEIEVNHRDEKNNLGVGQAQVWNKKSIIKVPVLLIAAYSMMLLASLSCFGPTRDENYLPQPKWRKGSIRPSCNDLVNLMRKEMMSDDFLQNTFNIYTKNRVGMAVNQ
jgi:hypothetical protein